MGETQTLFVLKLYMCACSFIYVLLSILMFYTAKLYNLYCSHTCEFHLFGALFSITDTVCCRLVFNGYSPVYRVGVALDWQEWRDPKCKDTRIYTHTHTYTHKHTHTHIHKYAHTLSLNPLSSLSHSLREYPNCTTVQFEAEMLAKRLWSGNACQTPWKVCAGWHETVSDKSTSSRILTLRYPQSSESSNLLGTPKTATTITRMTISDGLSGFQDEA